MAGTKEVRSICAITDVARSSRCTPGICRPATGRYSVRRVVVRKIEEFPRLAPLRIGDVDRQLPAGGAADENNPAIGMERQRRLAKGRPDGE